MSPVTSVFWDFGGVVLSSPFEAFQKFEADKGLPEGFLRTVNATNPDTNAWARFERSEVDFDQFCDLFEAECRSQGHEVAAREIMPLLSGEIRPAVVDAIRTCKEAGLLQACLTNNVVGFNDFPEQARAPGRDGVLQLFDHVIESSKVGVRKPDLRFYELACETIGVAPEDVVYLDDLGINLKPARAMGMTTIKVIDPDDALAELEKVTGLTLR